MSNGAIENMPEQVVNVQGAASVGLAITTWLVDMAPVFQVGATIVAIAVGITASLWNLEKYRAAKRERKRAEAEEENKTA